MNRELPDLIYGYDVKDIVRTIELLKEHNKTIDNIVAIKIEYAPIYKPVSIIKSLEQLDFDYDAGYGLQEIYGYVLLNEQDWFERQEYDGLEWWEYKKYPSHLLEER